MQPTIASPMQPTPQELHAVRALIQRYCLLTASSAGQERPPSERYLLLRELKGLVARHLPEILDKFFPQRGPHTHANDLFIPFAELVVGETLRDACRIPGFKSKKRSIFLGHMPVRLHDYCLPLAGCAARVRLARGPPTRWPRRCSECVRCVRCVRRLRLHRDPPPTPSW